MYKKIAFIQYNPKTLDFCTFLTPQTFWYRINAQILCFHKIMFRLTLLSISIAYRKIDRSIFKVSPDCLKR